jgi:transcriptional regulator with XRE-family HTH domain
MRRLTPQEQQAVIASGRKRLGMTQRQFAKVLGIAQSTVSNLELGVYPLSQRLLTKIAVLIGKEEVDLLFWRPEQYESRARVRAAR